MRPNTQIAVALFISALLLMACAAPQHAADNLSVKPLVWPQPPLAERIRYSHAFSLPVELGIQPSWFRRFLNWISGDEPRALVRPYTIAVTDKLIAVADPGAKAVTLYNTGNKSYIRINNTDTERFQSPIGVAVSDSTVYISDSRSAKLYLFKHNGDYISTVEGFKRPTGLAYHTQSARLYVADTLAHKIIVLDKQGKRLFDFGKRKKTKAGFNFPSHLAIYNDRLYVNDTMNFRIQVFDLKGRYITRFGKHGDASGHFSQPKGVSVDQQGHIYVADSIFHRVQIFDIKGRFLLDFGQQGQKPGEFWLPAGLFIRKNRIYVADSYNSRIQVFDYTYREKQR